MCVHCMAALRHITTVFLSTFSFVLFAPKHPNIGRNITRFAVPSASSARAHLNSSFCRNIRQPRPLNESPVDHDEGGILTNG